MIENTSSKYLLTYLQYVSLLDIKTRDYKVLLYLMDKLNIDDYININQKNLSDELNISKSEVSKAIKALIDNNIIELDPELYKNGHRKRKRIKLTNYSYDELTLNIENIIEKNINLQF